MEVPQAPCGVRDGRLDRSLLMNGVDGGMCPPPQDMAW
jgi:hypothetical protein